MKGRKGAGEMKEDGVELGQGKGGEKNGESKGWKMVWEERGRREEI